jgi:hypothetical protein
MYSTDRATAAVILLLILTSLSQVYGVFKNQLLDFRSIDGDLPAEYRTRFKTLNSVLPTRGVVGYLGDRGDDRTLSRRKRRLTQYALAPLVVANTTSLPVVVANLHSNPATEIDPGLRLLIDGGNGVALYERREISDAKIFQVPAAKVLIQNESGREPAGREAPGMATEKSSHLRLLWFAPPMLIGFLFTGSLLSLKDSTVSFKLLTVFMSIGVGLGISSCLTFFVLLAGGITKQLLLGAECATLIVLALVFLWRRKTGGAPVRMVAETASDRARLWQAIAAWFFLATIIAIAVFTGLTFLYPSGGYDAYAIWNLRAKFLFAGGEYWTDVFSRHMRWSNLAYPLMIPAIVARGWSFAGFDDPAVPIIVAALFTFGTVGILGASLAFVRSRSQAFLACSLLLGTPFFLKLGAWQMADLPLAFFFLATVVLLCLSQSLPAGQYPLLILAGLCAGLTTWTKNEGLLFFAVTLSAVSIFSLLDKAAGRIKRVLCYVLGAAPLLLITWYFKAQIVPGFPPVGSTVSGAIPVEIGVISRLLDHSRHFSVLTAYQGAIRAFGEGPFSMPIILIFYSLVLGITKKLESPRGLLLGALSWLLMFCGYYLVYILASTDLTFYSLDRVLMQLWPSALFLFFMFVHTPEEVCALSRVQGTMQDNAVPKIHKLNVA